MCFRRARAVEALLTLTPTPTHSRLHKAGRAHTGGEVEVACVLGGADGDDGAVDGERERVPVHAHEPRQALRQVHQRRRRAERRRRMAGLWPPQLDGHTAFRRACVPCVQSDPSDSRSSGEHVAAPRHSFSVAASSWWARILDRDAFWGPSSPQTSRFCNVSRLSRGGENVPN